MKSERLEQIDQIFQSALDLLPEERSDFLNQACMGDAELRAEIDSLLLAHDRAGEFIEDSASDLAAALLRERVLTPGRVVGQYQVEAFLGAGGAGEVYLAQDTRLERKVALKILPQAKDREKILRFTREARTASGLNHPNILTIYEIGLHHDINFIVAEYIAGRRLREHLAKGPLPLTEALDIAGQIASALAAAHEAGIVHRDIKPENIMLRPDGLVKVLDFGLAKLFQPRDDQTVVDKEAQTAVQNLTTPGLVMGTVNYMSPEQARGLPVDSRTDLWSLGVVLYEMCAGQRPFARATVADTLAAILTSEPKPLAQLDPDAPDELREITRKTLRKDPAERYQTAKALITDLKSLQKRLEFESEFGRSGAPASSDTAKLHQVPAGSERNSIAVLPFVNMSADAENEYFCDGLAEELLNALAKIDELKVAARTSAFSFKGKNTRVSEIGNALNVKTVLEGSVRKSGNRVRITAQLVSAADGYHLWSERYDREMKDIFDVQDEITLAVVDALKLKLLGDDQALVLKRFTENNEAYELFLKGRFFWFKFNPEALKKSQDCFEQALQKDPDFAPAYAGLALSLVASSVFTPPKDVFPKAKEMALEALKRDSSLAEAWNSRAAVKFFYEWDWAGAESDCLRSIDIDPRYVLAHDLYSLRLLAEGRFAEALSQTRAACELDPLSGFINATVGFALYFWRRYDEATDQLLKGVELDPGNFWIHMCLVDLYEQRGMHKEALHHRQELLTLAGSNELAVALGQEFQRSGYHGVLLKSLDDLEKQSNFRYVSPLDVAAIYERLGEPEKALDWLEKAVEERTMYLVFLKVRPTWESLHSNPRYVNLLRRVGFTS